MNDNVSTPETKKEPLKINLDPKEFPGQAKCLFTNTLKLCDAIGSILKPVFRDYAGCKILINNGANNFNLINQTVAPGAMYVNLYFTYNKDDAGMENLKLRSEASTDTSDLGARLNRIVGGMNNRVFEVTDDTKEVIVNEFLPPFAARNPRWAERITEHAAGNTFGGREQIVVCIAGLDLGLFIQKLYGLSVKDESGAKTEYDYSIVPIRQVFNTTDEYVLQITQMDKRVINDVATSIGIPSQSRGVMYNAYNG